jgi:hypothetical protein
MHVGRTMFCDPMIADESAISRSTGLVPTEPHRQDQGEPDAGDDPHSVHQNGFRSLFCTTASA